MDRFPEAFERFERVVPTNQFKNFRDLKYAFTHWAGRRWVDSYAQNLALKIDVEKRGFKDTRIPNYFRRQAQASTRQTWRRETVIVRDRPQIRHRDLRTGRFIKKPWNIKSYERTKFFKLFPLN